MPTNTINRRSFIGTSIGAAVGASVPAHGTQVLPSAPARIEPSDYITLGRTGVRVSRLPRG